MSLTDWQVSFRDLVMGDGTSYVVQSMNGLNDTPGVRTGDQDRSRRSGQFAGDDYATGRAITATVEVAGQHPDTLWDALSRALVIADGSGELPLGFRVPGVIGGREGLVYARCRRFSLPSDQDYAAGHGHADIQWWATDPRLYDAMETVVAVSMASISTSGLTFPATFPLSFGGATSGGISTATNVGEYPAPWTATIAGPITNPRVENITTGETLSFVGTLAVGETLTLDSEARSVLLGGASRYSWLAFGSKWFDLVAGDNQIRLAGTAGAGSLELRFHSAWI